MDNNVINNNLSNGVSPNVVTNTVNTNVSNGGSVANNISSVNTNTAVTGNVNTTPIPNTTNVNSNMANVALNGGGTSQKNSSKLYVWIFVFVGIVIVVAIILLIMLFTGTIDNRNRLTCTKTTQEDGYDYTIKRYYILENGINQRLELTYTFDYNGTLTDDLYESTFRPYLDNTTTKYGFDTKVTRDGDIVTITAYQPTFFNETEKELKSTNASEGYSCK